DYRARPGRLHTRARRCLSPQAGNFALLGGITIMMTRVLLAVAGVLALAGASGCGPLEEQKAPRSTARQAVSSSGACPSMGDFRGQLEREVSCTCDSVAAGDGRLWGTDYYSD